MIDDRGEGEDELIAEPSTASPVDSLTSQTWDVQVWPIGRFPQERQILGRVVTPDGNPVEAAHIDCIPAGYVPYSIDQRAALSAVSGPDGLFELLVPDAPVFHIRAAKGYSQGATSVRATKADRTVVVQVDQLYYARYELVDTSGAPISIRDRALYLLDGPVMASTQFPRDSIALGRQHSQVAGILRACPGNALVNVYAGRGVHRSSAGPLRIAGFEAFELPPMREQFSSWPKSKRVTLRESSNSGDIVRYRILFPQELAVERAESPPLLTQLEFLKVNVIPVGQRPFWVSRQNSVFDLPAKCDFELKFDWLQQVEYTLSPGDIETVVKVQFPKMCSATIRYPVLRGRKATPHVIVLVSKNGHSRHYARMIVPGQCRIGPIPEGEYELLYDSGFNRGVSEPLARFGPVKITGKNGIIEWR